MEKRAAMEGKDIMAKATEMEAITANSTTWRSESTCGDNFLSIMLECKADELFSMKAKLDKYSHLSQQ